MAASKSTTSTTKKEEIKIDIPLKGVKAKLQTVRVALMDMNLKKTGENKFAGFKYYELADFLPEVQKLFAKIGLTSRYTIAPEIIAYEEVQTGEAIIRKPIIRDMAKLIIVDIESSASSEIAVDNMIEFKMAAEPVQIGNNTKQNSYQAAGGRSTYYKRYLYRDALELEESDESDAVLGAPNVNYQEPQVTPYSFQTPQPVAQPVVQPTPAVGPVTIPTQPVVENTSPDAPLTETSRQEIMTILQSKGLVLEASNILMSYCTNNKIANPGELKEKDKVALIAYLGNL